jgi:hypothetical protein
MARGGTRVGAGRPPDPESRRQMKAAERADALSQPEAYGEWTELPKSGRTGRVPAWPLPTRTNAAERKLWNRLWKMPQAIMWEHDGQELQVALYVRRFLEAEERGAPSALTNAVLRMQDALGISELGMRSLRWRIVDRTVAAKEPAAAPVARKRTAAKSSSKARLTVVSE